MGYQKVLVDNITCSRRFHLTFDPDANPEAQVSIKCPFCDYTIFTASQHPAVKLVRQENLIQAHTLSDQILQHCDFSDNYKVGGVGKVYPEKTK